MIIVYKNNYYKQKKRMISYIIISFLFLIIVYLIKIEMNLKLIIKRKNNQILYYKNIA